MKLRRIQNEGNWKKYIFESYLRENYVENALVITTDEENRIQKLFFNSYEFGTAELDARDGLVSCNRWETEDAAQSVSYLARRYPVILQNGAEDSDHARIIMTRILERIDSAYLNALVENFCKRDQTIVFDAERFGIRE